MPVICVANQKGGVGKSTVTINLAAALALKASFADPPVDLRILVIDMDPQTNSVITFLGGAFGEKRTPPAYQLSDFLLDEVGVPAYEAVFPTDLPRGGQVKIDCMYAQKQPLKRARTELQAEGIDGYSRLQAVVEELSRDYDYIFIDTGPADDILVENALMASTHVLIPAEASPLALVGVEDNLRIIEQIRKWHPDLKVLGLVPSRVQPNYTTQSMLVEHIQATYGDLALPIIYQRSANYDAISNGLDVFSYRPARGNSLRSAEPATGEFADLLDEILRKMENGT